MDFKVKSKKQEGIFNLPITDTFIDVVKSHIAEWEKKYPEETKVDVIIPEDKYKEVDNLIQKILSKYINRPTIMKGIPLMAPGPTYHFTSVRLNKVTVFFKKDQPDASKES